MTKHNTKMTIELARISSVTQKIPIIGESVRQNTVAIKYCFIVHLNYSLFPAMVLPRVHSSLMTAHDKACRLTEWFGTDIRPQKKNMTVSIETINLVSAFHQSIISSR